jgi:hypothetical protein
MLKNKRHHKYKIDINNHSKKILIRTAKNNNVKPFTEEEIQYYAVLCKRQKQASAVLNETSEATAIKNLQSKQTNNKTSTKYS